MPIESGRHGEEAASYEFRNTIYVVRDRDQRRRLAVRGKVLGRKFLEEIGTLFTPDTILRWHREPVAQE